MLKWFEKKDSTIILSATKFACTLGINVVWCEYTLTIFWEPETKTMHIAKGYLQWPKIAEFMICHELAHYLEAVKRKAINKVNWGLDNTLSKNRKQEIETQVYILQKELEKHFN